MASETCITVWGQSLEEATIQPLSDALAHLGFAGLQRITDDTLAGGTRRSPFVAYSACFRCVNTEGNLFPLDYFVNVCLEFLGKTELDGGITIWSDTVCEEHTLLRPASTAQINSKSLESGIIHVKD